MNNMNDIYSTQCHVYGIKIYIFTKNKCTILFERKYNTIMCDETIVETKLFYEKLDETVKNNIKFKIYTRCENKCNNDYFMVWLNVSHNNFIKKFRVKE